MELKIEKIEKHHEKDKERMERDRQKLYKQIELLIDNGAKKVFSSYPIVNSDTSASYMHRIPFSHFNNTKARIWFNILRRNFKI